MDSGGTENNMKVKINVERGKGLFSAIGEPKSIEYLPRFLRDAHLEDDPTLVAYTTQNQGVRESVQDLGQRLKEWLARYDVRILSEETRPLTIAVNELHCPRVPGTRGELKIGSVDEESDDCTIEVLGIGGGDQFKLTVGELRGLTVENNCVATYYSVPAVWQECEVTTPDNRLRKFVRLDRVLDHAEVIEGKEIVDDACRSPDLDKVPGNKLREFNLTQLAGTTMSTSLKIDSESTWTAQTKLSLKEIGLDIGATLKGKRSYSTELTYTLAAGHRYCAYMHEHSSRWLWKVLQ
jgi:hypothetical protein